MRRHSLEASAALADGQPNDLLERLAADAAFGKVGADALRRQLEPARYIGRAPEQVSEFLEGPVDELLAALSPYDVPDEATVSV
jgi:adenylosuccinate lyase